MSQMPQKTVAYVASQELAKISSLLPSNRKRSMIVHSLINALGLMSPKFSDNARLQVVTPTRATYKELSMYHTREYLDFVLDPKNSVSATADVALYGLEDDCPPFLGLHEYVPLVAGATLTAVQTLTRGLSDIAICWDGGRHHAKKSQASGFCYVADCILALMALKRSSITLPSPGSDSPSTRKSRIMYLDLDLHFSDAVSEAFHSRSSGVASQILTLSVHHAAPGFFPSSSLAQVSTPLNDINSSDPFTLSLPLKQGASDSTYHRIWHIVERVKAAFDPDYVVIQCGVDALAGDPCGTFNWSLGTSTGSMGWCISRIVQDWKGKKLFLGGGGYHSANAARAWAYLTSIMLGQNLDLETEIPDHTGFPLYGPSFTLDVPPGNMQDQNSNEYLDSLEAHYEDIITFLKERALACHS